MRNRLIIDDTERQSILERHKQAILKEQNEPASADSTFVAIPKIPNINITQTNEKSLYYKNADGTVGQLNTPIRNYPTGAKPISKEEYESLVKQKPVTNNSPSSAQPVKNNSSSSTQPVKNKKVIELQNKLLEKGFGVGETGADGIFGQNTLNAVMNLIKRYEGLLSSSQSKQIQPKTAASVSPPTETNTTSQSKTATSAPQPTETNTTSQSKTATSEPQPTNQKTPTPTENNRPLDTTPTEDSSNI